LILNLVNTRKYNLINQYFISISFVLLTSIACYFGTQFIGYKTVALILLVTVSIIAMLFDILPVLSSAVLSALIWNYFFIPPILTFHIDNAEDLLMFLLYFFIALVNAVLTFKIREQETKARDKEEKEKTIKLYNTLLNSLSHELRTPISTIIGAVDTLKDNEKITKSNQLELLNQIDIASIRLNRQVENLLNMSRLETEILKLNIDWCDTNELINSVIQKLSFPYQQTILFEANEHLPFFKYDRGLIEQIIQNLLHNAIIYTPENTIIEITAKYHQGNCVIIVSDNGEGIPKSEIHYLFDKFYRGPKAKAGGSGLGLSIVQGFVEAHKGTVRVENNPKSGLSFIVEFPTEVSYLNSIKNE
jgi:two-component system sensor histidine kinase KdpD